MGEKDPVNKRQENVLQFNEALPELTVLSALPLRRVVTFFFFSFQFYQTDREHCSLMVK